MSDYPRGLDTRPLTTWPGELTRSRTYSPFSATLTATLEVLTRELREIQAKAPVLEVAIPVEKWRIDGRPYADARATHPGVVLSLPETKFGPLRYACDRFHNWQDNLRAIALGMEALRKVERYGITKRGEQYSGFAALPATREAMTLEIAHGVIEARGGRTAAIKSTHPDHGGDVNEWHIVDEALRTIEAAL